MFVDLLPGGGVTVHDDYGYYPWHPRPGAGRDEVFIGQLPDGVGVVFDGLGNFAQQNLPGALGVPTESVACSATGALADDLGAVYDNLGMAAEHLHHPLAFVGIGASSMAVIRKQRGEGSVAVERRPAYL